jgi:hypothetical protein
MVKALSVVCMAFLEAAAAWPETGRGRLKAIAERAEVPKPKRPRGRPRKGG